MAITLYCPASSCKGKCGSLDGNGASGGAVGPFYVKFVGYTNTLLFHYYRTANKDLAKRVSVKGLTKTSTVATRASEMLFPRHTPQKVLSPKW